MTDGSWLYLGIIAGFVILLDVAFYIWGRR
jgi:hypothetical protein